MSERKPAELMSVDAFSQLPFIRQGQPSKENNGTGIRLFGIEFPPDRIDDDEDTDISPTPSSKESAAKSSATDNGGGGTDTTGGDSSSRRFECHYCCRNFPTSQALGGHQNAHKRERQQAKRAHLQSMHMSAHHGKAGHAYSILNYHPFGEIPPAYRYGIDPLPASPYFPWSSGTAPITPGHFAGPGSVVQPINGCPVPGVWRVPAMHRAGASMPPAFVDGRGPSSTGSGDGSGSSHNRIAFEQRKRTLEGAQDHLSLDLHL